MTENSAVNLAHRNALLSRLAGLAWPEGPLLDSLALSSTADVLDVGAGDGRLLEALRRRGHQGRRVGLDPLPAHGLLLGTAEALPFPDASFDAVLLVRVLTHLSGPAGALAEARRVLRPGGRLIVARQGKDHLAWMWRKLDQSTTAATAEPPHGSIRLNIHVPVLISAADARAIAASYGLPVLKDEYNLLADFPVQDSLHLSADLS